MVWMSMCAMAAVASPTLFAMVSAAAFRQSAKSAHSKQLKDEWKVVLSPLLACLLSVSIVADATDCTILPIAMITPIVLEVAQQQPFQQRRWLMEGMDAAEVAEKKAEMNIRNQEKSIMQQALLEMQWEQALEKVGAYMRALSTLSPLSAPCQHTVGSCDC